MQIKGPVSQEFIEFLNALSVVPAFFVNAGILADVEGHPPHTVGQALLTLTRKEKKVQNG